jgi:hypothetical protein
VPTTLPNLGYAGGPNPLINLGSLVEFSDDRFLSGGAVALLTVARTGDSACSVDYATQDSSAIAGTDYTETFGTLTWADGDSAAKTISVPVTGEGGGAFLVILSNPEGTAVGVKDSALVTIGLIGNATNIAAGDNVTIDRVGNIATINALTGAGDIAAAVAAEAALRAAADATLQTNIGSEATARASADTTLQANLDAEATTRANADTALQTSVTNETAARIAGDAATLASARTYADGLVVGLWDDRGLFDASVNAYPTANGSGPAGAILKGDIYTISVAGTLPTGKVVEVNDTVRALVDTPGNTQANWAIAKDNTQTSVSGNAGTATALQTARNIDGQSFNGTADITVIAPGTHAASSKATPVDADELPLVDSAASNVLKKLTWANLKATLKTYFDTLYQATVGFTTVGSAVATLANPSAITFLRINADNTVTARSAANFRSDIGVVGKQAIYIAAGSITPSVTGGCAALATVATSANHPDLQTLDFDTTTQEYAQFSVVMPSSWDEGTVTFKAHWSHAATTVNFGVVWNLQALAISDDDAIDAAFGTAQQVADTGGTTSDLYTSAESSAITVAGSPAAGDVVFFRISRVTGDASDTMAIDARLHGITLFITTDACVDA